MTGAGEVKWEQTTKALNSTLRSSDCIPGSGFVQGNDGV